MTNAHQNIFSGFVRHTSKKLLATTAMTALGLTAVSGNAKAADDWTNHTVVGGDGSISYDPAPPANTTNITQIGHRVKVQGDGDIKAGWTVNLNQDTSSSQYILFDIESDPTQIMGQLNANGEVYIFDNQGVIFGADSQINVASIVASSGTLASTDGELDAGKIIITDLEGTGAIELQSDIDSSASITVAEAGVAAFVSPHVTNSGVINAKMGTVALAAGNAVTLDLYGDGLVEVAVHGELTDGLIENSGDIIARGGNVLVTAKVAKDAVDSVINMGGFTTVSSASVKGGKIVLSGGASGKVNVTGTVQASGGAGQDAGSVEVTGENIDIAGSADVRANATGSNEAGNISVIATNALNIDGDVSAQGLAGTGFIETSAPTTTFGAGASVLATREWLLDPTDVTIDNPLATLIEGQLAVGDMTVQTPAVGGDAGNITFFDVVNWATANTFKVIAHNDINFSNGGGVAASGLGNFIAEAGDDFRMYGANSGILLNGGDATITTADEFTLESGFINVGNGNLIIDNAEQFQALDDSLQASGTGTITINQNKDANGQTITTDATIQNAVDAISNTGTGKNTIYVGAGTFEEQVSIDKSLDLIGSGKGVTTILSPAILAESFNNGNSNKGVVYAHDADDINISDLTVDGDGNGNANYRMFGILYKDAGGVIDNVHVTNIINTPLNGSQHGTGIQHYNTDTLARTWTVQNSMVDNFQKNGITATGEGLTANILNNMVTGAGPTTVIAQNGIQVGYGAGGEVSGNTISGIGYTPSSWSASSILIFDAADGILIDDNTITGTGVDLGIAVISSTNSTITNNMVDGSGFGIYVDSGDYEPYISWGVLGGGDGTTIMGNTTKNGTYGIYTYDIDGQLISNNRALNNDLNGIHIDGGANVMITDNSANNNVDTAGRAASDWTTGIGIFVDGVAGDVEVSGNVASGNDDGIRIRETDGAIVSNNSANNNLDKGIISKFSDDIQIVENILGGNSIGVYLDGSANGLIKANTINNSTDDGVHLRGGSTSAQIENNFIRNSGDAALDVESAAGVVFYDNSVTGNAVLVKNGSGNIVDASFNWWGTTDEATIVSGITGPVDISPYQGSGVDTSVDPGYQGGMDELYVTDEGAQTSGLIQEAIDMANASGTVFVNDGAYTENIIIDKALKLTGLAGATLTAETAANLITVTAAGVNIDPFVFDGAGMSDYGVYASGAGAAGLVVDGNTFKNFNEAGIYVAHNGAATGTIINNIFEGSSTRGVETGTLNGGYALDITDNTIGADGDEVVNGLLFGQVRNATVNISGGSIDSAGPGNVNGDAIHFKDGTRNGATVNVSDITIVADDDEAIDFQNTIRTGSEVNITGGTYTGGNNSIEFAGIDGEVKIANAIIEGQGADKRGINLLGAIKGLLDIHRSRITGGDDGIGSNDDQNNTVDGGTFEVTGSLITGTNGDGIELGAVKNGATVNISDNIGISGGDNGVHFVDGVDGSDVTIAGNASIAGGNNGILFGAGSPSISGSTVDVSSNTIHGDNDGVHVEGEITDSTVTIGKADGEGNTITAGTAAVGNGTLHDGIYFGGDITGTTRLLVGWNNIDSLPTTGNGATSFGDMGVRFDGFVNVDAGGVGIVGNNISAGEGQEDRGISFWNGIGGSSVVRIAGNTIESGDDGVGVFDIYGTNQNESVRDDANLTIEGNTIGTSVARVGNANSGDGNGIDFQSVTGNSNVTISGNDIWSRKNAVEFDKVVDTTGAVNISDNTNLNASQEDGIQFAGGVIGSLVTINDNLSIIGGSGDGIFFGGGSPSLTDTDVTVSGNALIQGSRNGIQFEDDVNNSEVTIGSNDSIVGQTQDGIKFAGHVTNGSTLFIGPASQGNGITGADDGIEFNGINGDSTVSMNANTINAGDNGVEMNAGSPSIEEGSNVSFSGNTVTAGNNGVLIVDDITGAGTTFTAKNNTINAGNNGFDIDNVSNGAFVSIGGAGINDGNRIYAGVDGIQFNAGIDSNVVIQKNRISAGDDGVHIVDNDTGHLTSIDNGAVVSILDNSIGSVGSDTIGDDGIVVDENITGGATLIISANSIGRAGAKVGDDGIDLDNITGGATVNIVNNPNNYASDNGILVSGYVNDGSTLNISSNNHGIHAGNHGIFIGGNVSGGADIDIHDNIISANENNNGVGDGVHFAGNIYASTINIGDGNFSPFNGGASNWIRGNDGIHFDGTLNNGTQIVIDGNRIGYGKTAGGFTYAEEMLDDGIQFIGDIKGNANVKITDNYIKSDDDGVSFIGEIEDNSRVLIGGYNDGNKIDADDEGIQFEDDIKDQSLVEISYNEVTAQRDGVRFDGDITNAKTSGGISENELLIKKNKIWGDDNGIHFAGEIRGGAHDTLITQNDIEGEDEQGIVFDKKIDDAHVKIVDNDRIEGEIDGVRFLGKIQNGATVDINDNESIEGRDEEAIHFFEDIDDSTVNIVDNENLRGGDHGIEFDGEVDDSNITISENNHGIHAQNHGIVFFDKIKDSTLNIHDNIISANESNGSVGDGIHFGDDIEDSNIYIGDGAGPDYYDNPSNIITGRDGIHFEGDIEDGSYIKIDGNRLGYYKTAGGSHQNAELDDDGIQFIGDIKDDSTIKITENRIQSDDDGISFIGKIQDDARVTIGGDHGKGNVIFADGDGIQFEDDIKDHSLLEISYNDIEAEENGIEFNGETSNHIHSGHDEEILIKKNKIEGDDEGIKFEGLASHELHDIVIRDNHYIKGLSGNGITHVGNIKDAELWIKNNSEIYGKEDGIHLEGYFYDDAKITIYGNGWDGGVRGRNDDGIHVVDTGYDYGADVLIKKNHVHNTGDDGIYVKNVEGVEIRDNEVHNTDGNGIYGSNVDWAKITGNDIWDTGENGIKVNPSDYVDIAYNEIHDAAWDGILVDDGYAAWIWDNHVGNVGGDGIDVNSNNDVRIWDNYIHNTGDNGIEVSHSNNALIKKNDITGAGNDGINVYGGRYVDILFNDIFAEGGTYFGDWGHKGAKRDGIHVEYSYKVDIIGNDITADLGYGKYPKDQLGAGRHGIYVKGSDYAEINYNDIEGDSEWSYYGGYKSVDSVGEDGIHVYDSYKVDIKKNDIDNTGENGIFGKYIDKADIEKNDIYKAGADGTHVERSDYVDIKYNEVYKSRYDGIDLSRSKGSDIEKNTVKYSGDNGIEVSDSKYITIKKNYVKDNDNNGILVDNSWFVDVIRNRVKDNFFGIHFDDVWFGDIKFNKVEDNFIGVKLEDTHFADVKANFIADNFVGLWAYGGDNGYIQVRNNVFLDNPYHAKFNSGLIDLSGEKNGNAFIGGDVALYFDAWHNKPWKLWLVDDDGFGFDTVADTGYPPTTTSINYGGTIGHQYFDGQEDYFVKLGSNTFTWFGDAIWLNGLDSTYAGGPGGTFSPADSGGVINAAQYAFLEDMFFHYPDVNNRGVFFFGAVPDEEQIIIDQEDVFRFIGPNAGALGGLNVTILGLPGVPGGSGPAGLNNIAPAAGGNSTSPEALNAIATAAGGNEGEGSGSQASCFSSSAMANAGSGQPINISYGGGAEDLLVGEANCGS